MARDKAVAAAGAAGVMTRYRRAEGVHSRDVDGEVFLVAPGDGGIFYLDALGGALWRALPEAETLDALTALFTDAFPEQDQTVLRRDLEVLLLQLLDQGFIAAER